MDEKLRKYYEERLSIMGSQGWKDLMEDVEEMLVATNKVDGIPDEKTLFFKKGEISIMKWLLGLKELSQKTYEELKNETNV